MKKLIFAALAAFALTACDKENGGEGAGTDVRLVNSFIVYDHGYGETYQFQYDAQNRIIQVVFTGYYGSKTGNITYPNANTMVLSGSMYQDGSVTCTLNSDGSISSGEGTTLTYSNGYFQNMTRLTQIDEGGYVSEGASTQTFTWINGNVASNVTSYVYPTTPQYNETYSKIFEYGTVLNKPCSIDLWWTVCTGTGAYMPSGWYGKSSANLPLIITASSEYEGSTYTWADTYRYETDSNGYVLKIYRREGTEAEELYCTVSYR